MSCTERLYEFLKLEPDWDSYGAKPIKLEHIESALSFIELVYHIYGVLPFDIAPIPSGGVQFEYKGRYRLEIDFGYFEGIGLLLVMGELYDKPHWECTPSEKIARDRQRRYYERHNVNLSVAFEMLEFALGKR